MRTDLIHMYKNSNQRVFGMIVYIKTFFRLKCFFASMSKAISMPCAWFFAQRVVPQGENQHNSVFLRTNFLGNYTSKFFFFPMNHFFKKIHSRHNNQECLKIFSSSPIISKIIQKLTLVLPFCQTSVSMLIALMLLLCRGLQLCWRYCSCRLSPWCCA